jgi:hypothetical protein
MNISPEPKIFPMIDCITTISGELEGDTVNDLFLKIPVVISKPFLRSTY